MKKILLICLGYSLLLFCFSSAKHLLFQSTAWDLGIFDQAVYLISIGETPLSSFTGFHMLGDHGAWMLYVLALLYKIFPSVYWLLAVQALSLGLGGFGVWLLAKQKLTDRLAGLAMAIYCLYPLVFNINLFDFHPEVMAVPTFLIGIWATLTDRLVVFLIAIGVILGCKAALSLTVAGMGLWLFLEKRLKFALIALGVGTLWFIVATQWLMPTFAGEQAVSRFIGRYSDLGSSYREIIQNFFFHPYLVLSRIFSIGTVEYMALLWSPIVYVFWLNWGKLKNWSPLIATMPALMMNILANDDAQRDLIHQYSLPILPFLMLIVIDSLTLLPKGFITFQTILSWALLGFILLSRLHFFTGRYWQTIDTWQATREALSKIQDKGAVLTSAEIAPHLSQRPIVHLAINNPPVQNLTNYQHILLNQRHPGWASSSELVGKLLESIKQIPRFQLIFHQSGVYLFSYSLSNEEIAINQQRKYE